MHKNGKLVVSNAICHQRATADAEPATGHSLVELPKLNFYHRQDQKTGAYGYRCQPLRNYALKVGFCGSTFVVVGPYVQNAWQRSPDKAAIPITSNHGSPHTFTLLYSSIVSKQHSANVSDILV